MARITVEDCEKVVPNKFDLVILAAQRTRQILAGDKLTVEDNDEKKPVIALREIAAETVSTEDLKNGAINNFRSFLPQSDEEEDFEDIGEEDTYNPYAGIEIKALEKEDISVVSDQDLEMAEDNSDNS